MPLSHKSRFCYRPHNQPNRRYAGVRTLANNAVYYSSASADVSAVPSAASGIMVTSLHKERARVPAFPFGDNRFH